MSEQAKPKGGLMKTLVLAVVVLLLLGGAGAGGYWWSQQAAAKEPASDGSHAAEAEEPETAHAEAEEVAGGLVSFEPFLVNLADPGRYLRTNLKLVVGSEKGAKELGENEVAVMRLRSALLELLAEQHADTLVTADGKTALKDAIKERAGVIAGARIVDVLFSDFVVQ